MNQLESWIYLEIGKLEFLVVFATFVHVAGFFEQSSHLHILVSAFVFFSHFSLMLPLPLYIFLCVFGMSTFFALSLPFQFFHFYYVNRFSVSHFLHIISVPKSLFLVIWHNFLIVSTKGLDHFNYFCLAIIDCNV